MHQLPRARPAFDVQCRYVRFRELRDDGYVRFDFAIGDPDLAVELILALADYRAFCRAAGVLYLSREQAAAVDRAQSRWRYGEPGVQE